MKSPFPSAYRRLAVRGMRFLPLIIGVSLAQVFFPAEAQAFGRLFFTPEQRQVLDHQRQVGVEKPQEEVVPEDPMLTVNGVVTRSSGRRTIWINGQTLHESDAGSGVAVAPARQNPGRGALQAGELPTSEVRVGGTVNRNSGETVDLLGDGSIARSPAHGR